MATSVKTFSNASVKGWNNETLADLTGLPSIPANAVLDDIRLTCSVSRDNKGPTIADGDIDFKVGGSDIVHTAADPGRNGTTNSDFSIMSKVVNNNGTLSYSSGATYIRVEVYHRNNALTGQSTWTLSNAKITAYYTEHTHSYTSTVTKQPTCTETGVRTYACSCGNSSYTEIIQATGHTEVTIPAVAPTCTATGLTAGKKCSVCGTIITAQQTVAALGHTWINATCTTPKTCSVCGATEGSALDHNYTSVVTPPTETSRGYTTHTCSRCGHSYVDSYTYMLIATCDPSMGIVIQQGTGIYNHGDTVTLTAEAQTAYKFVKWSDDNTDNPRTVTVTANKTYTAIFERAYYELGLERSEGFSGYGFEMVSGSRYTDDNGVEHALKFIPGTVIAITANSEEGYIFSHWFDGNTDNPRQFTMSKDITLLAYFVKRPPEFTSVQMLYQNKQISKDNKVLTGEFFRIVVGAKSYD